MTKNVKDTPQIKIKPIIYEYFRGFLQKKGILSILLDTVVLFLFLLFSLLIKVGNLVLTLIKFIFSLKIPKIKLPTLPKIKIILPEISFPQIKLPSLPKIVFPHVPEIIFPQIPKISFPHIPIVYYFKVLVSSFITFLNFLISPLFHFPRPHFPQIHIPHLPLRQPKPIVYKPVSGNFFIKFKYFFLGIFLTLIFVFLPFEAWTFLQTLPQPQLLSQRDIPVTTKIFDRNGTLLYEIYADQNRTLVSLSKIPNNFKNATLAIEDKDFYKHLGFSPKGIIRAVYQTFINHQPQGGSTITQQLVRTALLNHDPTIERKIKEIILSFWAERLYNKDQILEMYFNQISYGGTSFGAEAASESYFGKKVSDLDLAEAAYLAGIPASPSVYSPYGTHPELGLVRQKEVLQKMLELGFIKLSDKQIAENEKLNFKPQQIAIKAPHFVMYVKDLLENEFGPRETQMGGLQVTTSLDLPTQEMAQNIVREEINNLSTLHVGNGAALVTNPKTGEILAMVGSKDYFDMENDGNVNLTLSLRQPGSSIKVVNYAAALQNGFTAATILDDSPIVYQSLGQPNYVPVNYDGKFHGKVTLRQALANSFNVPAVKVLAKLGVSKMIDQGRKMGITSWDDDSRFGLSLTLGGGEVTMLDMARVFGTLANRGMSHDLTAILKVTDYKGEILNEASLPPLETQTVSPGVSFILADILNDNNARSWEFGPNSSLVIPGRTVSVKTGTTNDFHDNWTIGFTPSYVVATWVGNNDNSPMSGIVSGITGAAPIWNKIMSTLLKNKLDEPYAMPDDVVKTDVCGRFEYFLRGTEKNVACQPSPSPSPSPLVMSQ